MKKDIENINSDEIMTDFFTMGEPAKRSENEPRTNNEKSTKKTKKDMFQISVKIDEDIEDYIKQIVWIKRTTRTAYINELIRDDFKRVLNAKDNINENDLQRLWEEYKNEKGL